MLHGLLKLAVLLVLSAGLATSFHGCVPPTPPGPPSSLAPPTEVESRIP